MRLPRPIRRFFIARAIRKGRKTMRAEQARDAAMQHVMGMVFPSQSERNSLYRIVRPPAEPLPPGRQRINMPGEPYGLLGGSSWQGPPPKHAHKLAWEDCHTFPGPKPRRESFGLVGDPPISFVCTTCDLEMPPLRHGERVCGYCGTKARTYGTSAVYIWRDPVAAEVPEWRRAG